MSATRGRDTEQGWVQPTQGPKQPADGTGWEGVDRGSLLVVVTLITTLTYQVGTNVPGGYWQDDEILHKKGDPISGQPGSFWNATVYGHRAGVAILSDKDPVRYWIFKTTNWAGFFTSLLVTLALLSGFSAPRVQWGFLLSYTCVVLSYLVPDQLIPVQWAFGASAILVVFTLIGVFYRRLLSPLFSCLRSKD